MKLVLVNQKLVYSSTTTYSFELCRALRRRGHELRLCSGGGELHELFRREQIETYTVRFNFFAFRKLRQFLREFDPQLFHVLNLRSLPMGQRLSEELGRPHLVTVHRVPSGIHEELRHPLLVGAIATSEVVREALVNSQRMPKHLIRVIRAGVQLERFVPRDPPLSHPGKLPVVGTIGRINTLKGYRHLIDAARRVLDRGREAHFVIVGDGTEERELRRQVQRLDLAGQVTFCPAMPDIADLIGSFDIVVVPSLRGGAGQLALEAMAMARPVIASAVGELLQIVGDGRTGLLVKEGDAEAIAEGIVRLIDRPEEAQRIGAAARAWVEENSSYPPVLEATEQYYQDLIDETTHAAGAPS